MAYKRVKLHHISLNALEEGHVYNYPIFYKDQNNIYRAIIKKNSKYIHETHQKIEDEHIDNLYVLLEDYQKYETDTQEYLSKIIKNDDFPLDIKSKIIHEMAADTINDLFEGELNTKKLQRSTKLVDETISLISQSPKAIKAIIDVTTYDYYTYTHCVNVSVYAIGFGAYLGFDEVTLNTLGLAAIFHDLGKKSVPNEIVNKNGMLTDEEFKTMKQHPSFGVKLLKELGVTNQNLLDLVEQHHEKLDGSGYPKGLNKKQLNPLSQIIAVCDIFDALTTKRSYKDALKSKDALDIMYNDMLDELDVELLEKFIYFMSEEIKKDK